MPMHRTMRAHSRPTSRARAATALAVLAALVPVSGVVGASGAAAQDELVVVASERAAGAAFDAAGLPDDPAGTVPLAVVTEDEAGHRRVSVTAADDVVDAARDVATKMREDTVVSVAIDAPVHADAVVDVFDQWDMTPEQLSTQAAWATSTGAGITVAVLDTGVKADHLDLSGQVLAGTDTVDLSTDGRTDFKGHGTHVAGTIAAKKGNGRGIAGVAPDAKILPVRVLDANGNGTMAQVADGIYWAVQNGADVINLSLGGPTGNSVVADALTYAEQQGVVVVASAGNSGANTINYPAAYSTAIAVCASDESKARWTSSSYSSSTPYVDICAPGVGVLSTYYLSTVSYAYMDGTSMAAPHVAGIAALVLAAYPSLTPAQVKTLLEDSADDMETPGVDAATGHGLVDPAAALALAATLYGPPATTTSTTTSTTSTSTSTTTTSTTSTTSTTTPASTTTAAPTTTTPAPIVAAGASRYVPRTPSRIVDTRATAPVAAGGTLTFPVAGRDDVGTDATAVVLNVTVTSTAAPGFVQVFPTGRAAIGDSSNLNVAAAGETAANLVTVPVGDDGRVSVYLQGGGNVLVDLFGWFQPSGATSGGRYVARSPVRVLDTRTGFGVLERTAGAGGTTRVRIAGTAGVPADGVAAVVLNLTATDASPGFVQAMPTGLVRAGAYSNVNVTPARSTVAGLAIVPLGDDGTITIYHESPAELAADVLGYVTSASAVSSTSGLFVPVRPARVLDTRRGTRLAARGSTTVTVRGAGGVPSSGASAVFGNVTMVDANDAGFLQAYPTGAGTAGSSSNVNVTAAHQTIPNAVAATLSGDGRVSIYSQPGSDVLFDVAGWFTA